MRKDSVSKFRAPDTVPLLTRLFLGGGGATDQLSPLPQMHARWSIGWVRQSADILTCQFRL